MWLCLGIISWNVQGSRLINAGWGRWLVSGCGLQSIGVWYLIAAPLVSVVGFGRIGVPALGGVMSEVIRPS